MKLKQLLVPAAMLLLAVLFGCGAPAAELPEAAAAEAESAPAPTEEPRLTVYYDYAFAWEESPEEVAETVKRLDLAGGEMDADGNVTLTLREESQRELLIKEAADYIEQRIPKLIEQNGYVEIETSAPYDRFTVRTDRETLAALKNSGYSMEVTFFYMGGYYQSACGTPLSEMEVVVELVDAETAEEIERYSLRERMDAIAPDADFAAYTFAPTVLYENDAICIRAVSLSRMPSRGYGIGLTTENRSEEEWAGQLYGASVNGLMVPLQGYVLADPEETKENTVFLPVEQLMAYGITDYTEIRLLLRHLWSETESYSSPDNDYVVMNAIAPYGAERAEAYVRKPQPTDLVLLDTPYATLVQLGQTKHADGGYTVELYMTYDAEPLNDLGEPLPSLIGETMHVYHMVDGMTMTSDACLLPNTAAYITLEVSSETAAAFSGNVPIDVQSYPNVSFYERFEIALTGE